MTTSTANIEPTRGDLYLAFELGWKTWELAFTIGRGQKPRMRTITAGDTESVKSEIRAAKKRFGLTRKSRVISCYEAGRDGFWLHRFLESIDVANQIVDSASIEVSRRKRRAKTDRLDAQKLVMMLIRWAEGESKVWSVVAVPPLEDEDARHLHRELKTLKGERTRITNRISSLSGLTGTPYDSGSSGREQGIDKAGNKRVRGLSVEFAWCWLRHQPESALSHWYQEKFGYGGKRLRKIGIVALARKLLIAMWRWVEQDVIPEGAALKA